MYRHKDKLLKSKRQYKKTNVNKESTQDSKPYKGSGSRMFYGSDKGLQQHLIDKYDIKVHKNVLRRRQFIDYELEKDNQIGNTTYDVLHDILEIIEPSDIPSDWSHKHDKTKWKTSKNKTKQRHHLYDDKYPMIDDEM